jgi:hypothetical protein
MRKIIGIVAIAMVAVLAGCGVAYGPAGNPESLTGTWNATENSVNTIVPDTVAGTLEGTWYKKVVTAPVVTSGSTIDAGDPFTDSVTTTVVVAADGSFTYTVVTYRDQIDRAEILYDFTGGVTTVAYPASIAGTRTHTQTSTVSVTAASDGTYRETIVSTDSKAGTGSYASYAAATTTDSMSQSSLSMGDLSLFTVSFFGLQHTINPGVNSTAAPYDQTVSTAITFVVAEDGGFTYTTVETLTQAARAALPAGGGYAASPAVLAGTRTTTIVQTGMMGSVAEESKLILNYSGVSTAKSGTGALVNWEFPTTAVTHAYSDSQTVIFDYSITQGTVGTVDTTWLTMYSSIFGSGRTFTKAP